MNRTVVITLGRNVGGVPMRLSRWRSFQLDIKWSLDDVGATIIQAPSFDSKRSHDQVGQWEGNEEAACAFVAVMCHDYGLVEVLRSQLAILANVYQQDAIGFVNVVGSDHLVTPPAGGVQLYNLVIGGDWAAKERAMRENLL